MDHRDAQTLKERSYFQAVHLHGTKANLAKAMGVKPDVIYKFLNRTTEDVGLAQSFARVTGLDESLFLGRALKNIGKKTPFVEIPMTQIDVSSFHNQGIFTFPDRVVLIDHQGGLISGWERFEGAKREMKTMISVLVLDLNALLLGMRCLKDMSYPFLLTERFEIGLQLEKIIGHHPGARHDLGPNRRRKRPSPGPGLDEVIGRKDSRIATILELGSKSTYHNLKTVCRKGVFELLQALNEGKIGIEKAAQIVAHEAQQLEALQLYLSHGPRSKAFKNQAY